MRARRPTPYALTFALTLALACDTGPTGTDVSGTELWRLELEQTHDGTTSLYPRRGTINLLLELNQTASPDPTCVDTDKPEAIAFLADVRALPSRLQESATGTAEGVWNCHGFAATVRLNDGTTYDLVSDSLDFRLAGFAFCVRDPTRRIPADPNCRFEPHRWTSGGRRGHFLFAHDNLFSYDPLDTHLDVTIENHRVSDATIATTKSGGIIDLSYRHRDRAGKPTFWQSVPAGRAISVSWLAHRYTRNQVAYEDEIGAYDIYLDLAGGTNGLAYRCFLASDHPDRARLVIDDDGLACSTGWLRAGEIDVAPRWLFLRPGETGEVRGTIVPGARDRYSLDARASHPSIATELFDIRTLGEFGLYVHVGQDAPRTEHGVIVMGVGVVNGDTTYDAIAVNVYDLAMTIDPDTIRVMQNDSAAALIRLNRAGLIGLDVRLSRIAEESTGTGARITPAATEGDSAVLMVHAGNLARPGTYTESVCAVILAAGTDACHAEVPFTLQVEGQPVNDLVMQVRADGVEDRLDIGIGEAVTLEAIVTVLDEPARGVEARAALPAGFVLDSAAANHGTYDPATGLWTLGDLDVSRIGTPPPTLELFATADSIGTFTFESRFLAGTESDDTPGNDSDSVIVVVQSAGSGSISGAVTVDGTPMTGETVTLTGDEDRATTTDGSGAYQFTGLAAGDYTIAIDTDLPPGTFPTSSVDVTLAEGEAATVDFAGTGVASGCANPTPPVAGGIVFEDLSGNTVSPPFVPGTKFRAVPSGFTDNVGGGLSFRWDPVYDGVAPNLTASGPFIEITADVPGTYGIYVLATDACHGDPDSPPGYDGTASASITYDTSF